ncbi:hypothetical protein Hanom_Chr02g00171991 [Helianthus anomalus]
MHDDPHYTYVGVLLFYNLEHYTTFRKWQKKVERNNKKSTFFQDLIKRREHGRFSHEFFKVPFFNFKFISSLPTIFEPFGYCLYLVLVIVVTLAQDDVVHVVSHDDGIAIIKIFAFYLLISIISHVI